MQLSYILTELNRSHKRPQIGKMNIENISVASLVMMSIVTLICVIKIYFVVLSMQTRPVRLAVTIPVQPRTDDQRAFIITPRVGNRPVPQENDE